MVQQGISPANEMVSCPASVSYWVVPTSPSRSVTPLFLNRGQLCPSEGTLDIWRHFGCHTLGGVGVPTGIKWVEARDAANILQCTGQHPTTENYPVLNVNSVELEKPCSTQ